jgi:hypothetical protein
VVVLIGALVACKGAPRAVDAGTTPTGGGAATLDGPVTRPSPTLGAAKATDAVASADAAIPGDVVLLETIPSGPPYDLRVDGDEVSFCDRRGARVLTATPGMDRASTRPCKAPHDRGPQFHCTDFDDADSGGGYVVTLRKPHGVQSPDHMLEAFFRDDYSCIGLLNSQVSCANDDSGLVVSTTDDVDGVYMWDVAADDVELLDSVLASDVAIGATWVAWLDEKTVRARRRSSANGGAGERGVPTPVTYRHYSGPAGDVDYPTFFRRSCNPSEGATGWRWARRASLLAWAHPIERGDGPTSGCHLSLDGDAGAVIHREVTKDGCFATALEGTQVHWARERYACGMGSGLEFEYDVALKSAFDPIVTHVNRSWRAPHVRGCPGQDGGQR